jgi:hypothetical protein
MEISIICSIGFHVHCSRRDIQFFAFIHLRQDTLQLAAESDGEATAL